jgi:hypothetical protein
MEQFEGATRSDLRLRAYQHVSEDLLNYIGTSETSSENIDLLTKNISNTLPVASLTAMLHNLFTEAAKEPYDTVHAILYSQDFKYGFTFGLEVNSRLMGKTTYSEDIIKKHIRTTFNNISNAANHEVDRTISLLRAFAVDLYFRNLAAADESKIAPLNAESNPLDAVVNRVLDDLYDTEDEQRRSLFCEGYGFARGAQVDYQKSIDEEFDTISSSIGEIDWFTS